MPKIAWVELHRTKVVKEGWYGVARCYDPDEGLLPYVAYLSPNHAFESYDCLRTSTPFDNEEEALDWVARNDPED